MDQSCSILFALLLPLLSGLAAVLFFPVTTGQWSDQPRGPDDPVLRVYVPQQCGPTVLSSVLAPVLGTPSRNPCGRIWTVARHAGRSARYCGLLGEVDHKRYYMHFIRMVLASTHLRERTGVHVEPADDPFAADVVLCDVKGVERFRRDAQEAGRTDGGPLVLVVENSDSGVLHATPELIGSNGTLAVLKHYAWRGFGGTCPRDLHVPSLIGAGRNSWPRLLRRLVASSAGGSPYRRLGNGDGGCPVGYEIASQAQCREAFESLLLRPDPAWSGSLVSIPSGCSVRMGASPHLHWNSAKGGVGRNDLAPVCRQEPPDRGRRAPPLTIDEAYALVEKDGCPGPVDEAAAQKVFLAVPAYRTVNFGTAFPPAGDLSRMSQRRVDVAFVGFLWRGIQVLQQHRGGLVERLSDICERRGWNCVVGASLPAARFHALLLDAKIFVSPFGVGEFSHKDEDAVLSGAVLMKPAAALLQATIPIYTPSETCLDVRPDWADLEEALVEALADTQGLQRISDSAQEAARGFRGPDAAIRHPDVLAKYVEIVRRASAIVHR